MLQQLLPALRITALLTILTGIAYPLLTTAICQAIFPHQANGSLIESKGKVVGSSLLGQGFSKPQYFSPRPSAAGNDGYDASASSPSNLGPTNAKLIERVTKSVAQFRRDDPGFMGPIPADLLTSSASGLDPEISPASAEAQVARVAKARKMTVEDVRRKVEAHTKGRDLGFLGEPRVNVLELNLELDDNAR